MRLCNQRRSHLDRAKSREVHSRASIGRSRCYGDNFAKAEGDVETMADGPRKFLAEREIAEAQDAMLGGKLSGCAMHLSQARQAESMSQAPYPGTMFSAPAVQPPAETTQETPSQPQGNWQP